MSQILTFEALPARKGDLLLLHFGSRDNPKLALIDGGPSSVFETYLKPRLRDIHASRGMANTAALPIDLLMISHIDDDHIKGILDLTRDLKRSADDRTSPLVDVKMLWHNSFDDIIGNTEFSDGTANVLASMGENDFGEGFDHDMAFVLSSVRQGRELRSDAERLGWRVNRPFYPLVWMDQPDDPAVTRFGGGLEMIILGPRRGELEDLQKNYDEYLEEKGLGRDNQEALLAAGQDDSVPNLSSIVALVAAGDKTILLTGDALGRKIEEALEARGLASEEAPLKVDILKMQHHGSDRNVTPSFFRKVQADHYVFCGDGAHGNPERATVEMLFAEQGDAHVTLHFTKRITEIDAKRKEEKNKRARRNKDRGKPFEFWREARDSLQALLEREADNRSFSVSEPTDRSGIRIHLLEPLEVPLHDV